MPKLSLKSMSVADLVALRDKVQGELARKIEIERDALQKQIAALSELESGKVPKRGGGEPAPGRRKKADAPESSKSSKPAKRRAAARYEGPNGESWSGFGRAPSWLTDLEAGGKSRESFRVAK
jgi:DNA-binding protein H-NS